MRKATLEQLTTEDTDVTKPFNTVTGDAALPELGHRIKLYYRNDVDEVCRVLTTPVRHYIETSPGVFEVTTVNSTYKLSFK